MAGKITSDDHDSMYLKLGIVQGHLEAVINNQNTTIKQVSHLEFTLRTEIEKIHDSTSKRITLLEGEVINLRLAVAKVKWKQSLVSGSVAFGVTIIIQVIFFVLNKYY